MLVLGNNNRSELVKTDQPFLLIDDGPLCDIFLDTFKNLNEFDFGVHGLNPLPADYKMRRRLPNILWDAAGKDTLTVRNGKRALRGKLKKAKRLDKIIFNNGDGDREAAEMVDDLLDSPVLRKVLRKEPPRWLLSGVSIVARIDRSEIEEFDAAILASLLAMHYPGNVIISDFGFYARDFHRSLLRQKRLSIGLNNLSELDKKMQQAVLQIPDKIGRECTWDDAVELAKIGCRFPPGTNEYNAYVEERMSA